VLYPARGGETGGDFPQPPTRQDAKSYLGQCRGFQHLGDITAGLHWTEAGTCRLEYGIQASPEQVSTKRLRVAD